MLEMVRVVVVIKVFVLIKVVEVVRKLNVPRIRRTTTNPTSRPCRKRLVKTTIAKKILSRLSLKHPVGTEVF